MSKIVLSSKLERNSKIVVCASLVCLLAFCACTYRYVVIINLKIWAHYHKYTIRGPQFRWRGISKICQNFYYIMIQRSISILKNIVLKSLNIDNLSFRASFYNRDLLKIECLFNRSDLKFIRYISVPSFRIFGRKWCQWIGLDLYWIVFPILRFALYPFPKCKQKFIREATETTAPPPNFVFFI